MKAAVSQASVDAGGVAFTTTHWSVVLAAQTRSPAADEALEKLRPARHGRSVEDAQDLTQSFFARLLERRDFDAVRKEKGRLRSYLLTSLKHFLVNDLERGMSIHPRTERGTRCVLSAGGHRNLDLSA